MRLLNLFHYLGADLTVFILRKSQLPLIKKNRVLLLPLLFFLAASVDTGVRLAVAALTVCVNDNENRLVVLAHPASGLSYSGIDIIIIVAVSSEGLHRIGSGTLGDILD